MAEEPWRRDVEKLLNELMRRGFRVEAAMLFGSWARSGGGDWSDLDILVLTDDVRGIPILERFRLAAEFRIYRIDLFLYTFDELKNMVLRGNPLALSALIEGIPIIASQRVEELIQEAKKKYVRKGGTWIRQGLL
ncbi:MAG: nucleotidyltransferase domain-containing protein [Sulfolobales archaeon]